MPPGRLIIAWRAKKRVEWRALSRLRYLTNWTNPRVRSTHLLHTKSPFSLFFGRRRQKNANIVVSARGRRTPQAPTLRILGCANARKYDYKSSSLYSQSNPCGTPAEPLRNPCGTLCGTPAEPLRNPCETPAEPLRNPLRGPCGTHAEPTRNHVRIAGAVPSGVEFLDGAFMHASSGARRCVRFFCF